MHDISGFNSIVINNARLKSKKLETQALLGFIARETIEKVSYEEKLVCKEINLKKKPISVLNKA